MQESNTGRALPQLDTVASALEQQLENEPALLDLMVQALSKGASPADLWEQLHANAQRDGRVAELAAAYDTVCRDRKVRLLQPAAQVELLLQGAGFICDVAGDGGAAQPHLERVMQLSPGNVDAFQRLETILREREDWVKLAELYMAMASHRHDKQEQLAFMRAAVQIYAALPGEEDKAFKLHQQILRLDPTDADSRAAMTERLMAAGRVADVAKLFEAAIAADPPPAEEELIALREQAIELYVDRLHELEKGLPHAEAVLAKNPDSELAWRACEQLLTHKTLAARAAAAIENVYMAREQFEDAARMLTIQIDSVRGPRRLEAQKRLALLQYDKLGDLPAAFSLHEGILTVDPNDDEVRARYRAIGAALDRRLDVTRVLTRASSSAKDPIVRAKIAADLGELFLEAGDTKRARASLQSAVDAGLSDEAGVRAAKALADLCEQAPDWPALATVLERLSDIDPDAESRAKVAYRLAWLYQNQLNNTPGAIGAYRKLIGTSLETEALPVLERLYESTGDEVSLADVLERRALHEKDAEAAKQLAFRAADLRAARSSDLGAVLDGWRRFLETYGPSRDIHARILPLLEREGRFEELAKTLDAEAGLTAPEERIPVLAKLARVRFEKLKDSAGAIAAYRQALDLDRVDETCRTAVEQLLRSGDQRIAAADVLEPIYRQEGAGAGLLEVLEVRAELASEAMTKLAALREGTEIADQQLGDQKRALRNAGFGLRVAVSDAADEVPEWLASVQRLAGADALGLANILVQALGERRVDHPALAELARATGEALAAHGDYSGALAVLRRALAFEPSSADLISRIDGLLEQHGTPQERLELHRSALAATKEPERRRELFHAIGAIQRHGLNDLAGAAATYKQALAEDPSDRAAYEAGLDVLEASHDYEGLYAALVGGAEREGDTKERSKIVLRMANLSADRDWIERAAQHYRSLLDEKADLSEETLDKIAGLTRKTGDNELYRVLLERRIEIADGPLAVAQWLERLAELRADAFGDAAGAIADCLRAGDLAESGGDDALAERLFERVVALEADHREAASRLVAIYRRMQEWAKLPDVYDILCRTAADVAERADKVLEFEDAAIKAGVTMRYVVAVDGLSEQGDALDADRRDALEAARTRVLAADPERQDEAALAYRRMIERKSDPWSAVEAFEGFLDRSPLIQTRLEDRRWVLRFRMDHAEGSRRVEALLAWASAEENVFKDAGAADKLYSEVLELDATNNVALEARSRILLDLGDVEGAASMIARRRDLREGAERTALELELSQLLLERLGRVDEALSAVEPVLDAEPGNDGALALLQRALGRQDARRRAAEMLERACDACGDEAISARILKLLIATPADASDLADLRSGWFTRLLDRPGAAPEIALDLALRAIDELTYDATLWERAEQLGRDAEKPELVADMYRKKLESDAVRSLQPEQTDDLGRRAVDYHEEFFFEDQDTVMKLLRRVVDVAPDAFWAFERLKLAYNQNERWEDLFSLYDQAIARTEDKFTRIELLEDAAESAKDLAGKPDKAIAYLEQLLPLKPRDKKIRLSLERLYERLARHRPLIDLLSQELDSLDVESAQKLRARIAALWIDGVADADAAYAVVADMLNIDPARHEAVGLLERILKLTSEGVLDPLANPPTESSETTARQRAAAALETRYRKEERHKDLARVLGVRLESAADAEGRGKLLREIVHLHAEVLGDPASALENLAALVALEPGEAVHRAELDRLAARVGRDDRLADVLVTVAAVVPGPLKIELLTHASSIFVDRLGDRGRAIEIGRSILALHEEHPELVIAPARTLEKLLALDARSAERCDVLERLAQLEKESDPSARRLDLLEAARLASADLEDKPRAIADYRATLADQPKDVEALTGLAADLEFERRFAELAEVLEQRAALTEGDSARADLVRVAVICDQELGDVARAVTVWEHVRSRFGADDESCDALAVLLSKASRWNDLVSLYQASAKLADEAGTTARAADLYRRLGDAQRDRTAQWLEAVTSYESAIRLGDAGGKAALSGLETLLSLIELDDEERRPVLSSAVRVLAATYAASGDWQSTISLLEQRLAASNSVEERTSILTETASLYEHRQGDLGLAFGAIWRAFAEAKTAELASEILRLARAADRWSDVAEAFPGVEAEGGVPGLVARDLWWNLALWHRDRRADERSAETAIERALGYDATNREMLTALVEIRRHAPGRSLVDALLRLSDVSDEPLPLHKEAVVTAIDNVGDTGLAKTIAEAMLDKAKARWASEGSDAASLPATSASWAIDVLVKIYREESNSARVVELCLDGAKLPFETPHRRALRLAAAEISEPSPAIVIYEELFGENPTDGLVGDRLDALYRSEGRRTDLLALREKQISVAADSASRVDLRVDLALLLTDAGEVERAIATLRKNLEENPLHGPSVNKLAELFEGRGDFAALAALWEDQAARREANRETTVAAELWRRAAIISETKVGDIARATSDYRRAARFRDLASLDALARLFTARGDHPSAAEVLEIICTDSPLDSAPHPVLRLAESYISAGEPAMARQRLEEALQKITDTAPVRARLSVLYREAEAWGPLAELTAVEAQHTENIAQRTKLLREAADLHVTKRNDPQSAVPLLEQAAALTPEDRAIKLTLCDALSAAGRIEEASAVLRQIIDAYGARRPKDRAVVHHYLARVYLASGDRSSALSELDVALKIDPTHPEILLAVARLSFDEGQYDRSQRTYRSLLMMVRRLRDEQANPAVTRTEVLYALAEIADKQGDSDRAVEHLESAFEAARENTEECDRLVRALRGKPNHKNLARALELRMEISGNETPLGTISELVALYEQHLDKAGGALDLWLKTVEMRPSSGDAHRSALALAKRSGSVDRYVGTLRRLIDSTTNDPPLIDLLLHLGRALSESNAEQADEIFARAETLLLQRPGDRRIHEVWRALEASSARRGDRAGQIAILEKRIQAAAESAPPADVADGLYRLAELVLGDAEHRERAIDALERALAVDPQPERAEAIFRRGLELGVADERLIELFEKFAREKDRPRALVEALVRLGSQRGVTAYQEAYATAQKVGDAALIEQVLRRAITKADDASLTPDDYWAVVALSALRSTAEDFKEAAVLEERAARIAAPDAERGHLIAAATIAKDKLGDFATAARIYAELFEREPADREVWEPLVDLYRRLEDNAALGKVLEQLISLLEAVEDRSRMRLELAALAQKGEGGDERAISVLAELLEDDPMNEQASAQQAALLEKAGRFDDLASLLERRIDAAKDRQDSAQVLALSTRLASLFEQQNDLDRARDAYFGVLDWDNGNIDALQAIVRICEKRGELSDVADALEKLLGVEKGDAAEKTALRLADVRTQQSDEEGVDRALEAGLRAFPASTVLGPKLKERLESRGEFRKLSEIHVFEADNAPDAAHRISTLRKAASILREKEEDLRGAIEILRKALEIDSSDRALVTEFVGAQAEMGDHQVAAATIASLASNLEAGPAVDLMLHAARVLIGVEGGGEAAVELVEDVRRRQPEAWDPVIILAEAYVAAGRIDDARPLAANAVAAFEGRRSKTLAMAHHAMAAVERASGNDAEALVQYTKAFEVDPTNIEFAMELGQYAVDRGEGDIAARALRVVTMAKASSSGVTSRHKALAYYHLGRLAASQGDRGKARLLVDKALAEDAALEAARNLAAELAGG